MKLKLKRGTTSKIIRVFLADMTALDGSGLTGLVYNSAGLSAAYIRETDATVTTISLSAGTVGTWSSGGFKEVDATNFPGLYELGLPNAALASGASTTILLRGAANMVVTTAEIELDAVDYQAGTITSAGSVTGSVGSVTAAVTTASDANVTAIKAKTDNLPANPAAVGAAMTIDFTQSLPSTPVVGSLGAALVAGWNATYGKIVYTPPSALPGTGSIAYYGTDGTTILHTKTVTMDSDGDVTQVI